MNRFRFSLGSFLIVVTLLALALAALVSQSRLAASAALTAYLVLLCLALAGALIPHTGNRAFWIGFAIFGWTYWFVEFDTGVNAAGQPRTTMAMAVYTSFIPNQSAAPQHMGLLTQDVIEYLETHLTPGREIGAKVMAQWRGGSYYSGTILEANEGQYLIKWDDGSPQQWTPSNQILPHVPSMRVAAHAVMGGLFALIGGVVVALFFGSKRSAADPASTAAPANSPPSSSAAPK
jgi:hypothetical protein